VKSCNQNGFTLVELLVVILIAGLTTTWALPNFRKKQLQGQVDRYSRLTESGLRNLRSRLREDRLSHCICFISNRWALPSSMGLERYQPDSGSSAPVISCDGGDASSDLRIMNLEGSAPSQQVEVLSNQKQFCISPPGTSASPENLRLLFRSPKQSEYPDLLMRCIEMNGNGYLSRGDWNPMSAACST